MGRQEHPWQEAAGETTERLKDLGLDTISLADGPAGLRLTKEYHLLEDGKAKGVGHALESFMEMMEPEEQEQLKKQMEAAKNDDQSETLLSVLHFHSHRNCPGAVLERGTV